MVFWIVLIIVVNLIALAVLIAYAIWLWHKASDVYSEIQMLSKRTEELADLLAQIGQEGDQYRLS
ncbi:MAG: hypothetical protein CR979_02210 [Propionibacterium sp.]|nr:MAG: hypothetical protein CR979_02210 [Propionibacterium sp.]